MMAYVVREFVTPLPDEETQDLLFSTLSSRYAPLLHSAYAKTWEHLGISREGKIPSMPGEIFVGNPAQFFYCLKFSSGLEIGALAKNDAQDEYQAFARLVMSVLGATAKRQLFYSPNSIFSTLYQEYGSFQIPEEDRKAAKILSDKKVRQFLLDVAKGGRRKADSATGPSRAIAEELQSLGMIKQEFLIFCRQTGNQIMMVESMQAIKEASEQGFKCFACGHPFSDETLTQFISLTPSGRKILASHRWLTISVLELLDELPAPKALCATSQENVTTLFLNIETSLIFIEMKESPYRLKDAYLLKNKLDLYKPAAAFLLLLSPPAPDLCRYLEELDTCPAWGSSVQDLKDHLPTLLSKAYESHAGELLQRFSNFSAIQVDELLYTYLFPLQALPIQMSLPESPPLPSLLPVPELFPRTPSPEAEVKAPSPLPSMETSQSALPSSKDDVVQKILAELQSSVAGRESSLHILLQDLSEVNRRFKACLFSEDGLVIASTLPEDLSEVLASYGSECFTVAKAILEKENLAPLRTLTMASKNFSVELYHARGFYLGVATPLEITVAEKLAEASNADGLKLTSQFLLGKKSVKAVSLLAKEGTVLLESTKKPDEVFPFEALVGLYDKLAPSFEPMEQGALESIALKTPSLSMILSKAGTGWIANCCEASQPWEELIPYLLALGSEASRFFSPVKS